MAKFRVLVVEDSLTVRRRLREVLEACPEFEVVGEAQDGRRAIDLCLGLRPDVITMDMMLPLLSGLAATEYIMAHCPTPILVVSSSFNRGEVFKTYDALAAGAVDVMEKPSGSEAPGQWEHSLLSALRIVARVRVITHPRARLQGLSSTAPPASSGELRARAAIPELVAIGASTGGPGALARILRDLPREFQLPLLIVLHLSEPFAAAFADWLGTHTSRSVAYARSGESIDELRGCVRLAPPGSHLAVAGRRLQLTHDPERHSCRPSIDVLFESLAASAGSRAAGCLLTGMGRDGASGLLAMRLAGATTLVESEETAVIYGMPREAVKLGAARHIVRLDEMGAALLALSRAKGASP
jgi:two-component system, chemotaxis family, protein-glutamate methylesterase/glutaminase